MPKDNGSLFSIEASILPVSANFCDLFYLVCSMISYKSHFSNRGCQTLQVGYRVLGVQPNSPAAVGGLVSFFDFIVAAKGIPLATLDSTFVELIKVCAPYRVFVSMLSSWTTYKTISTATTIHSKDAAIESPRPYLSFDLLIFEFRSFSSSCMHANLFSMQFFMFVTRSLLKWTSKF